jgi:ElaB/YqjD/DUF883 family membrane-anchored ribosome-binding protein
MATSNDTPRETPTSEELAAIKRDLRGIRTDFVTLAQDVAGLGKEGAEDLRRRAREKAAEAEATVKAELQAARQRVRERPIMAVLAALGAGVVLGVLLRRKMSRP